MDREIVFSKIAELKSTLLKPKDRDHLFTVIDQNLAKQEPNLETSNEYGKASFGDKVYIIFTISDSYIIITDIETPRNYFNNQASEKIINQYLQINPELENEFIIERDPVNDQFPILDKILPDKYKESVLGDLSEIKREIKKDNKSNYIWFAVLIFTSILLLWSIFSNSDAKEEESEEVSV